jgi:hypothetical protein
MTAPAVAAPGRVTVRHDRRARRFLFGCTCGWKGDTANLSLAAQPIAEHLRICTGKPPFSRKPYRPERFADSTINYPKPPEN